MSALLSWLDLHGPAIQALATIVLVGVTVVYVILTGRLRRETARSAAAAQQLVAESQLARVAALEPLLMPVQVRYAEGHPTLLPGQRNSSGQVADAECFIVAVKNVGTGVASAVRVGYSLGVLESWTELSGPLEGGGTCSVDVRIVSAMPSPPELLAQTASQQTRAKLSMLPVVDFALHIRYQSIFGREHSVSSQHRLTDAEAASRPVCPMLGVPVVTGHALAPSAGIDQ